MDTYSSSYGAVVRYALKSLYKDGVSAADVGVGGALNEGVLVTSEREIITLKAGMRHRYVPGKGD
jgi:hypothetical protein